MAAKHGKAAAAASPMQLAVCPGDVIRVQQSDTVSIGEGLTFHAGSSTLRATRRGLLCSRGRAALWVEGRSKRYVARLDDAVLGVVDSSGAEFVRVNLFGTRGAKLPVLAFEGATKRNRPALQRGTLVFCRVVSKGGVLEPELSCISPDSVGRKDWFTGEALYGELQGGFMQRCSSALARQLLRPDCVVLLSLAKHLAFEIAVGANGAFWVRAGTTRETCVIVNALKQSEMLNDDEIVAMVGELVRAARTEDDDWEA